MINLHGKPNIEPGRPVYVLLSADETHVASLPDGSADWSYNQPDMELRRKILVKDFGNNSYTVISLVEALTRISNKQAELEEAWKPAIKLIKEKRKLHEAWSVYTSAKKKLGPHPLRFDSYLKNKLQITNPQTLREHDHG